MKLNIFSFLLISFQFNKIFSFCPFHKSSKSQNIQRKTIDIQQTQTPLQGQLPITTDLSDPYVQSNNYFHEVYQSTQIKILPTVKILNEGDYMVLFLSNGTKISEPFVSNLYHNLKMISHLPVTVYSILLLNETKSIHLTNEVLVSLTTFLSLLDSITITSNRFPDLNQLERQIRIYNQTYNFVIQLLNTKECSFNTLSSFAWSTSTDINLNLNDAASDSINLLHSIIMNWKTKILSRNEWNELYVATVGRFNLSFSLTLTRSL